MPTTTPTVNDLVRRYADDFAYVAEKSPATDLEILAEHAGTAAQNFSMVRVNGHEDVETAAGWLLEAHLADDVTERDVFLRKADKLFRPIVWEMTQEYREMVGD